MFCEKCGNKINEEDQFCEKCGNKVTSSTGANPVHDNDDNLLEKLLEQPEIKTDSINIFCHKCGNELSDDSGFCHKCGIKIEREAIEQQTLDKPAITQEAVVSTPIELSYPKKKKWWLPLISFIVLISAIIIITLIVSNLTGNSPGKDFLKFGSDKVPTVKYVLGERNVFWFQDMTIRENDGTDTKQIEVMYSSIRDVDNDIKNYALALRDDYGFTVINGQPRDFGFDNFATGTYLLGKNVESNYYVAVLIKGEWERKGYTITYIHKRGEIILHSDNTDADYDSYSDAKFEWVVEPSMIVKYEYYANRQYIEGAIKNITDRAYYVIIKFILYDSSGNQIGTASDAMTDFKGGNTWQFSAENWGAEAASWEFLEITYY